MWQGRIEAIAGVRLQALFRQWQRVVVRHQRKCQQGLLAEQRLTAVKIQLRPR
jgi:hypothetical protein